MVRFSDMLGDAADERDDERDDEPDDEPDDDTPSASGGDAIERLAQFAAAPHSRSDEPHTPAPPDDPATATASADLVAALPAIDDTFLPSRAKRH